MLQFIRDKSQGWIAWAIIIAICIPFALWGVKSYLYGHAEEGLIVKVNGSKITKHQIDYLVHQLKMQQQNAPSSDLKDSKQTTTDLKKEAIQSMISSVVSVRAAQQSGFRVAPELVEATLAKMPAFQVNGVFSSTRFEEILNRMLYSPQQFFDQLSERILINQVQSGLVFSSFSLPYEVEQFETLMNQQRSFRYLLISCDHFALSVPVSAKEIETYYQAHLKDFETPEQVSIEYILLSLSDLIKTINPTEEQLKSFYQANLTAFSSPAKWQMQNIFIPLPMNANSKQQAEAQKTIQAITEKIKLGVPFIQLIQQYSQDKSTAVSDKKLSWVTSGQLSPAVSSMIIKMKKGDISTPIKIANGYQILKAVDAQPSKVYAIETVKNRLLPMYKQQKAEQLYTNLSDQLANVTYESPNSLQPASEKLGLKIKETALFTRSNGADTLTRDPRVMKAAFSEDVLNQDNNSELINLDDNRAVVLRKKLRYKPVVRPLEQVKASILRILQTQKAKQKVKEIGDQLLAILRQGKSIDESLASYRLKWIEKNNASVHDKSVSIDVLSRVFLMSTPSKGSAVSGGFALGSGDFVLIQLLQVQNKKTLMTDSQKRAAVNSTANGHGFLEYAAYFQNLMAQAKIKYYENQAAPSDAEDETTDFS